MSEDTNVENVPSELEELKARADQMGVSYHPSIGLDKLREKVNAALTSSDEEDEPKTQTTGTSSGDSLAELKRKASEQVRIRVACMNPNKREHTGEMFCCGNAKIGTFKKFVPFDTDWHVPRIIFNMIQNRKCQIFVTEKAKNGRKIRVGKLIKEYSVDELPPLTEQQLKELAQRQAMANGTSE